MGVKLDTYNNKWYKPGSVLKRLAWHYTSGLFFRSGLFPLYGLKVFMLRSFGAKIGKGVLIKPYVNIKYPWFLRVGDHCWIGENVWIDNLAMVTIGSNVCISQGAYLLTGNHDHKSAAFDLVIKQITIGDGVWIGAGSVVCPGVICNTHALLSVGSVLTGDMEAYGIYKGNPATKTGDRVISI